MYRYKYSRKNATFHNYYICDWPDCDKVILRLDSEMPLSPNDEYVRRHITSMGGFVVVQPNNGRAFLCHDCVAQWTSREPGKNILSKNHGTPPNMSAPIYNTGGWIKS